MAGAKNLSLRGGRKPPNPKPMVSFRCPPELIEYVRQVAKNPNRDQTEVITSAIALDRDLAEKLLGEKSRLLAFAEAHGLDMHEDLAEILAQLVQLGLEAYDREKKPKKNGK